MGIKKRRPMTSGQRFRSTSDFSEVTTDKPERSLLKSKSRINGRNSAGRITVRRRGGGHKRKYRMIDFKRDSKAFQLKLLRLNMIQIVVLASLFYIMQMVRNAIFYVLMDLRLVLRLFQVRMLQSKSAILFL